MQCLKFSHRVHSDKAVDSKTLSHIFLIPCPFGTATSITTIISKISKESVFAFYTGKGENELKKKNDTFIPHGGFLSPEAMFRSPSLYYWQALHRCMTPGTSSGTQKWFQVDAGTPKMLGSLHSKCFSQCSISVNKECIFSYTYHQVTLFIDEKIEDVREK